MLIAYRPELENPPREAGFGIVTNTGLIQLVPGLNQDIPEDKWSEAKANKAVQRLMAIGAIEELQDRLVVEELPDDTDSLAALPLSQAIRAIELIHDTGKLVEWKKKEGRIRVRNAISKRQEAIRIGKA